VYGLSTDPPARNKKFKEKYKMNFHLLSDEKRELLDALGAKKGAGSTLRSSWVIGKGGVIEMAKLGASPPISVTCALEHIGLKS
jgi:thioredoxin-dependent peroxiredoxin